MTPEDLREAAIAVAQERLEAVEYSVIYEDEELEHLTEEEMREVHRLVVSGWIVDLTWEDCAD